MSTTEAAHAAGVRSRQAFERAKRSLAGGANSPVRAGKAVGETPPIIASASGSRITDVDGREYVDYQCAYGAVLLGHAHARIAAAVSEAARQSTIHGATHPEEIRLAERIRQHIPSIERVRFVSTGTEACMSAVRVARAFTRREKIVRFEGNYHGHCDEMIFAAGASANSVPNLASGVTSRVVNDVVTLPYNDIYAVDRTLRGRRQEIAAIILEPIVGNMGLVFPERGFLEELRAMCYRSGAVLIFDEVITGFRLGLGGAQGLFGVRPDLTCIGKTVGGGLPIAAYGGRADIMALLAPEGSVFQGGTFSGNPLCVAAAHAFLDALEGDPGLHARLDALGRRLADGARDAVGSLGLDFPVVQIGSIVDFMFRRGAPPHRNYAQAREADAALYARYYWAMLERGIFLPPSQMEVMFLTAAHTEADVDAAIRAMRKSLSAM